MESGRGRRANVVKSTRKSNRTLYLALAAIVVVGAFFIYRSANAPAPAATLVNVPVGNMKAEGHLYGKPDAPVQIIEFADFECPACGQFATITEPDVRSRLVQTGVASLRFYDFPLSQHRNSLAAHNAAACAADQNKFWEMHDRLFAGQLDWSTEATSNPMRVFERYARDIGLDVGAWQSCVASQSKLPQIRANQQEGERQRIQSTPTFIIGSRVIPGALSYDELKRWVDSASAAAPTPTTSPASDSAKGP
jgi:protein-disulfide isomerase